MRILVTGTGGGTGFVVAKLLSRHHEIVAADADVWAPGLQLPFVTSTILPLANDPIYMTAIKDLCVSHNVDAIIAGTEEEQRILTRNAATLAEQRLRYWGPSPQAIDICIDKWAFFERMRSSGVPVPETWKAVPPHPAGDLVVKPRRGRGSRDVFYAATSCDAMYYARLVPDVIFQRRAHGVEFTADCLAAEGRDPLIALRSRLRVRAGVSTAGVTFHDDAAFQAVADALRALDAHGAVCVQGIITDYGVEIIEANARFAGSFLLSEEAGADLLGRYLEVLEGAPPRFDDFHYADGVSMTRAWTETFGIVPTKKTVR